MHRLTSHGLTIMVAIDFYIEYLQKSVSFSDSKLSKNDLAKDSAETLQITGITIYISVLSAIIIVSLSNLLKKDR